MGLIVDSFAGGGGASLGIKMALGREPDIAINHDAAALAMHAANHPATRHVLEDVWRADLPSLIGEEQVDLFWASPDCRHFSRAKGGKPVSKSVRSLAWVVCRWAAKIRPRTIFLENVREFSQWGPLVPRHECRSCGWKGTEGQARLARIHRRCPRCDSRRLVRTEDMVPDPARKGLTFNRFVGRLRGLGYVVEWQNLDAADFGAPTHRRRLFLIARRDGQPIVWPAPTHAAPDKVAATGLRPHRTAAECIDWSIPCPSIFERSRPLAEKTMRRIAHGIKRYVLDAAHPFIVKVHSHGFDREGAAGNSVDCPMGTVVAKECSAVVVPHLVHLTHAGERQPLDPEAPLPTVTGANRGEIGLVVPTLVSGYGERAGQAPRATDPAAGPLGTVVGDTKHAVVAAYLAKHFGGMVGVGADTPLPTTTGRGTQTQIVTAYLARHFGNSVGSPGDTPTPTLTSRDGQTQLVSALLQTYYGNGPRNPEECRVQGLDKPVPVVPVENRHGIVAANLVHLNHGDKQWSAADEPLRTVTTGKHAALVYAFLLRYFGTAIGQHATEPLFTVTGKDRFGLVLVLIGDQPYVVVDIGMRMLTPRELARAQGFPDSYVLTGSKTNQVARIGNSVCPDVVAALVRANVRLTQPRRRQRVLWKA